MTNLKSLKERFDFITEVRGRGLLLALEFNQEIAEELVLACLGKGLLVNKVKPTALRFMPPLIISEKEVDKAIEILGDTLEEKQRSKGKGENAK
jgi:acetylornithine/N-succinyldiaminopimelate aminotransferase